MAHSAQHAHAGFSLPGLIQSIGSSIYSFLIRMAESQSRVQQVEYLHALSDEELQKRGLTRDRIVHRVFADSIWL